MFRESDLTPVPKALDWHRVKIDAPGSILGVMAGKMWSIRCHQIGKVSKPCVAYATGGKLKCRCADGPLSVRTVCYMPIITSDSERAVVILSAVAGWKARLFKPGSLLRFVRPRAPKRPTAVRLADDHECDQVWVKRAQKKEPEDILEWLCHLWQIHALTAFLGFSPRQSLASGAIDPVVEAPYEPRFLSPDAANVPDLTAPPEVW